MLCGSSALNAITEGVIGAGVEVHRAIGPGLLESAYQACLVYELAERGYRLCVEKPLPIVYRNVYVSRGYRIDILVEDCVIVEVKAVDALAPIHHAQMLAYLKLANCPVGLILNFNSVRFMDGIRRVVNRSLLGVGQQAAETSATNERG